MMEDLILVGFGGHAKSVADCIERQQKYRIVGYTDLKENVSKYQYLGQDCILQKYYDSGVRYAAVGIGYMGKGNIRQNIYNNLKKIGYTLPPICDPSAIISSSAEIGEGVFIGKSAIINAEARIGKMVIINTNAIVEHECVVDDFAHIAVSAVLCGQVQVGNSAFIGANATIIQCRKINPHTLVPAGVVVR